MTNPIQDREIFKHCCNLIEHRSKISKGNAFLSMYSTCKKLDTEIKVFDIGLANLEKTIEQLDSIKTEWVSNPNFSIEECLANLTMIKSAYLVLLDLYRNFETINAKLNRSKQKREDPNKQKARDRAKQIWQAHRSQSLSDTAYQIKQELDLRKSASTIQEWIRDLNPNSKKKSK